MFLHGEPDENSSRFRSRSRSSSPTNRLGRNRNWNQQLRQHINNGFVTNQNQNEAPYEVNNVRMDTTKEVTRRVIRCVTTPTTDTLSTMFRMGFKEVDITMDTSVSRKSSTPVDSPTPATTTVVERMVCRVGCTVTISRMGCRMGIPASVHLKTPANNTTTNTTTTTMEITFQQDNARQNNGGAQPESEQRTEPPNVLSREQEGASQRTTATSTDTQAQPIPEPSATDGRPVFMAYKHDYKPNKGRHPSELVPFLDFFGVTATDKDIQILGKSVPTQMQAGGFAVFFHVAKAVETKIFKKMRANTWAIMTTAKNSLTNGRMATRYQILRQANGVDTVQSTSMILAHSETLSATFPAKSKQEVVTDGVVNKVYRDGRCVAEHSFRDIFVADNSELLKAMYRLTSNTGGLQFKLLLDREQISRDILYETVIPKKNKKSTKGAKTGAKKKD